MEEEKRASKIPDPSPSPEPGPAGNSLDDILSSLSAPREKVSNTNRLEQMYEQQAPPVEEQAEAGLMSPTLDAYMEEGKAMIGLLDSFVGMVGTIATGGKMPMARYQRFAENEPPEYYVRAWARVIEKHQFVMSPEWLLLGIVATIYTPSAQQVWSDRTTTKTANEEKK